MPTDNAKRMLSLRGNFHIGLLTSKTKEKQPGGGGGLPPPGSATDMAVPTDNAKWMLSLVNISTCAYLCLLLD